MRARDLRDQLALVGRAVAGNGLVVGSGGNLSARDPGSNELWVTAAGTFLDHLDRDDFVPVGLDASSSGSRASTELPLHLAVYRARPDINAVIHLHPQVVVLLDALGERIRLVTTDHAYYVRRVATTPFHPPGTDDLARVAADAVRDGTNCVILAHHGCSVIGDTVEMALRRALNLEEAARMTYRALLLTGGIGAREIAECPAIEAV